MESHLHSIEKEDEVLLTKYFSFGSDLKVSESLRDLLSDDDLATTTSEVSVLIDEDATDEDNRADRSVASSPARGVFRSTDDVDPRRKSFGIASNEQSQVFSSVTGTSEAKDARRTGFFDVSATAAEQKRVTSPGKELSALSCDESRKLPVHERMQQTSCFGSCSEKAPMRRNSMAINRETSTAGYPTAGTEIGAPTINRGAEFAPGDGRRRKVNALASGGEWPYESQSTLPRDDFVYPPAAESSYRNSMGSDSPSLPRRTHGYSSYIESHDALPALRSQTLPLLPELDKAHDVGRKSAARMPASSSNRHTLAVARSCSFTYLSRANGAGCNQFTSEQGTDRGDMSYVFVTTRKFYRSPASFEEEGAMPRSQDDCDLPDVDVSPKGKVEARTTKHVGRKILSLFATGRSRKMKLPSSARAKRAYFGKPRSAVHSHTSTKGVVLEEERQTRTASVATDDTDPMQSLQSRQSFESKLSSLKSLSGPQCQPNHQRRMRVRSSSVCNADIEDNDLLIPCGVGAASCGSDQESCDSFKWSDWDELFERSGPMEPGELFVEEVTRRLPGNAERERASSQSLMSPLSYNSICQSHFASDATIGALARLGQHLQERVDHTVSSEFFEELAANWDGLAVFAYEHDVIEGTCSAHVEPSILPNDVVTIQVV